ncbi:glutamate synthase [Sulfolobus sp. S-194]|uniref:class II glutamine amidotransferase n=1 Tax=Sulfolobus sp. S-194 TaxID=2512240 RepID=UPI0014370C56|nr:glutamate synthase [Sulfolobus sp. S-194]QIW24985.1 glutamate synthase [Sulfolobus sp. S-194]
MIHPSGCGVLGILRKRNASKISGEIVVKGIERVRYRGSDRGAGFAVFDKDKGNRYIIKVFYEGDPAALKSVIESHGIRVDKYELEYIDSDICDCKFYITLDSLPLGKKAFRNINEIIWSQKKGRLYSFGTSLQVFKGVGYPKDVAQMYKVEEYEGDLWLAHTRQPTNSPGYYPFWSHPFSSFNIAIVHNGDVSSFGANLEYLMERNWEGFVGTDSEVIAFLFEELISEGFSVEEAIKILVNPSRRFSAFPRELDYYYRNARLDGPFTAVIGYDSGDDLYLIALADRSKFRPAIIGEDDNFYYVASEENEIREISPNAKVWTLKPGSYFIASLNKGVISYGRDEVELKSFSSPPIFAPKVYDIDARNVDYKELNELIVHEVKRGKKEVTVANVMGHRYIGINFKRFGVSNIRVNLYGVAGNAMANLNEDNYFYVYGNVADDCCDTMHGGKVVIYGDARDVLAQTFQNGKIFVKGNAGNRVGIQMREYKDKRPYLIIGGIVDDYLGEYMAGGVIVVLGTTINHEPVGNFVGSGMVGGRIYIRGKVSLSKIGLQPPKIEIVRFLKALLLEGLIDESFYDELRGKEYIEIMDKLEGKAKEYAKRLFEEKVGIPKVEYRELTEEEFKELFPIMKEYSSDMGKDYTELLKERFTVILARGKL